MPRVDYIGEVQVGDMHSRFDRQIQPPIRVVDWLDGMASPAYYGIDGMEFDPLCGCACTARVDVPHDQKVGSGVTCIDEDQHLLGVEDVTWDTVTMGPSTYYKLQHVMAPSGGYQTMDMQITDAAQAASATLDADTGSGVDLRAQGFRMNLTRAIHVKVPTNVRAYYECRWTVVAGSDLLWYRLTWVNAGAPSLSFSDDAEVTWTTIRADLPSEVSAEKSAGNAGPAINDGVTVEVRVMNAVMVVNAGGNTAPIVLPLDSDVFEFPYNAAIDRFRVKAAVFTHMGWAVHLHKRRAVGTFRSIPHQLGFVPDPSTQPWYEVIASNETGELDDGVPMSFTVPVGSTLQLDTLNLCICGHEARWHDDSGVGACLYRWHQPRDGYPNGEPCTSFRPYTAAPQYDLTLTNATAGTYGKDEAGSALAYSDATATINRISTCIEGLTQPASGVFVPMLLGQAENPVKSVTESASFDINSMTVHRSAEVVLSNWQGLTELQNTWGIMGIGNMAVSIALGYQSAGNVPQCQRFLGYCDTYVYDRPSPSSALLRLICVDQMQQLREVQMFAPPVMDGWNHYYAIAYLANYAGITDSQLAFLDNVPDSPFESKGEVKPYFLPMGQGNGTWTPINRAMAVLDLMDFVRKTTGYLLYFGEDGRLYYHQWVPADPASPYRTFYDYGQGDGSLAEYWSLSTTVSTRDVRNQVITVGIDSWNASWPAIVTKVEDADSIWSPPGEQPVNYKGYKCPFVWTDSRFAKREFAQDAAYRLYRWLRQPSLRVTFSTWAQPDIPLLGVIYVNDPRGGGSTLPLYVVSQSTTYSAMGRGYKTACQISAVYLDPTALSEAT